MSNPTVVVSDPMRLDQFVAKEFSLSRAQSAKHIRSGFISCDGVVSTKASKMLKIGNVISFRQEKMQQQASPSKTSISIHNDRMSHATRGQSPRACGTLSGEGALRLASLAQGTLLLPRGRRAAALQSKGELDSGVDRRIHSPANAQFSVLFEDTSCLVINKPQGISVHPASTTQNEPTVVDMLRKSTGQELFLVHRLDKGTSGCLLIAKSVHACEELQRQFSERTVEKQYLAIVLGVPEKQEAMIMSPVGRSLLNRTKMSLFHTGRSREATTSYVVLSVGKEASLLKCDLHTGRTHQIRVHLASIGHPLLGDEKYGSEKSKTLSKELGIANPCLHAQTLSFVPPHSHKKISVTAPLPTAFLKVAQSLSLKLKTLSP